MSVQDVERASLTSDAIQERQLVGSQTVTAALTGNTVGVDRQKVTLQGRTVDVEIALVDRVNHSEKGRPVDKMYTLARNSVVARLNLTKWSQATVISCLPIELRSDSCLDPLRDARVPAVKDGEPLRLSRLQESPPRGCTRGTGRTAELLRLSAHHARQGVRRRSTCRAGRGDFAFIGKPEDVENPELGAQGEPGKRLKKRAITYMESMHREARQYWDQKTHYAVREPHRASIRRLHHLGYIKELPAELDKQRDTAVEYPVCGKCQLRQDSPHAIQCQRLGCGWIIDPERAYKNNVIAEDDSALERLTRAQVKELGISPYVAETSDEKPVRLADGPGQSRSQKRSCGCSSSKPNSRKQEEHRRSKKRSNSRKHAGVTKRSNMALLLMAQVNDRAAALLDDPAHARFSREYLRSSPRPAERADAGRAHVARPPAAGSRRPSINLGAADYRT
jgi:hypothetical protein